MSFDWKQYFVRNAQLIAGLALLWGIIAFARDVSVATLLIIALITAYLIEFYAVRSVFDYFRTGAVPRSRLAVGIAAVVGALVVTWLGMGVLVVLFLVSIFWIDAIALRFR